MVKVKAPLFSIKASGDLASAIQYVCGSFTKKKPRATDVISPNQETQRNKFLDGAKKWKRELTEETKKKWEYFRATILMSKDCAVNAYLISPYNLWMSYWLHFGENGWKNYPDPPVP